MTDTDPKNTPEEGNEHADASGTSGVNGEHENIHDLNAQSAESSDAEAVDPEARIQELATQLAQQNDRMMRALAEAENTRKRAQKDREEAGKFAIANFARDLLGFSDNFGRALAAIPEDLKEDADDRLKSVLSGIEAMEKDILGVFEKHKVQKIIPLDEPFDPNFHEVMFEAPMPDKQAGTIIEVIEPGYVLHERLLRPARVGIAKSDAGAPGGHSVDTQA